MRPDIGTAEAELTLPETLRYMREHLNDNRCYLPEAEPLCIDMTAFTKAFADMLAEGMGEAEA